MLKYFKVLKATHIHNIHTSNNSLVRIGKEHVNPFHKYHFTMNESAYLLQSITNTYEQHKVPVLWVPYFLPPLDSYQNNHLYPIQGKVPFVSEPRCRHEFRRPHQS